MRLCPRKKPEKVALQGLRIGLRDRLAFGAHTVYGECVLCQASADMVVWPSLRWSLA